jgi:DNA-binding FadR family transcriptional regulator
MDNVMRNLKAISTSPEGRTTVRIPKTAEVFADHIRKRIIMGELKDGDCLPPEGKILETLSMSRPTLREAFRILEAEGLVSVSRGARSGARIHAPKVESASRYAALMLAMEETTIADIYEARIAVEPYVARRLAETRPAGAVKRLREQANKLGALVDEERYSDFMIAIAEFHRLLVEIYGNKTLLFLTNLMQDLVSRYQVQYLAALPEKDETRHSRTSSGVRSFHKLIDLIAAGEAAKAEAHWRLHVVNANKAWATDVGISTLIKSYA